MYHFTLTKAYAPAQADMPVLDTTVGGLLRDVAAAHPGAEALLEIGMDGAPARSWTYQALWADAERLAGALASRFAPGERIAVWSPNTPEWVILEYACALAGLTLVTANPAYQARELRYVLEQSGAAALFCTKEYRGNPMAEIAKTATEDLSQLREIIDMDDWAAMTAVGQRTTRLPDVAPGSEVQIQYTSGTTGFPKGARLHHRGLTNNARFFAARCGIQDGDVWGNYMPLFHTAGCAMAVLGSVQNVGRLLLFKIFEPNAVLDQIAEARINTMTGVPTMLVALLEAYAQKARDVSSIRMAVSGGSMVAPELVRRITSTFGCAFQTVYGQTEGSPVVTQHHSTDSLDDIAETIGQPLPQTAVSIRRTADNTLADVGEIGEICYDGYLKMLGYNANEAATTATIDADGWLHSGDLGTMDARGYVRVTGRVKEMIIRGGENLFPVEIENALLEHPDVAEIAVVGLPDETWGEIVAAFIRPAPGADIDIAALKAHCRERLAPIKTPVIWAHAAEFPLTGSGKIQKFALREQFLAGDLREF